MLPLVLNSQLPGLLLILTNSDPLQANLVGQYFLLFHFLTQKLALQAGHLVVVLHLAGYEDRPRLVTQ